MTETPLVAGPLYGLRSWRSVTDAGGGGERLAAVHQHAAWPPGGASLTAVCGVDPSHAAPVPDCECGAHAWHPRRASARRVLASRAEIPGVVEATGAVEVHHEGFRAASARPHALFLLPGRNPHLVRRLGEAYGVPVVPARGPDDVLAWCQAHGLGLSPEVVDDLIGDADARRLARRRKRRNDRLRVGLAVALSAGLLAAGLAVAEDEPGPREGFGRTGTFTTP